MTRPDVARGIAAAALLLGTFAMARADIGTAAAIDALSDCTLSAPGGFPSAEARCGELAVPEDPARPAGRQISLRFAVVPARVPRPQPDPVVYLAGGPGQAATEAFPMMQYALRRLNRDRHILLLDQRGTGGSNRIDCDFGDVDSYALLDDDTVTALLRDCLDELDADPRFYTTREAAGDLERLRAHLGFSTLNLIGGSYGTRKAQVYLRHYPERVRTMILDSTVPMTLKLGIEHGPALDDALRAIFADCAAEPACQTQFPDLAGAMATLLERYGDEPVALTVDDPRRGTPRDVEFGRDMLAVGIRFLAYAPETQALLPQLIHEAATSGNAARLASQALMVVEDVAAQMARGMELSVLCSEDFPHYPHELDHSDTLLGNALLDYTRVACGVWPADPVPASFHEPLRSDVPVLLLSGARDPVTPPRYGSEAAAQFAGSRHLILAGQAHIVLRPGCTDRIAEDFVSAARTAELDVDCAARAAAAPFFLNLLGPSP